jgi:hypothetical protein
MSGPNIQESLTVQLSTYMIQSLCRRLGTDPRLSIDNDSLTYDLVKDCEMIVGQVCRAFQNQSMYLGNSLSHGINISAVRLPWSIEEYAGQLSRSQNIGTPENEARLKEKFPPIYKAINGLLPLQDEPCIVMDSQNIIVLWYMPDALSKRRNVDLPSLSGLLYLLTGNRML